MRHRLLSLVVVAAALAASAPPAAAKDSVTIGMALEPPTLDPTTGAAAAIGEIAHDNIFEGLVKLDENFNVSPQLAETWTFSPDFKRLTFALRPGVRFQDGEPFGAKDVKYSFERAAAPDSTNKDKAFFASIQSIDASDPATVTLTFKAPSFQALYHLGLNTAAIVNEKSAAADATRPIGTGPYRFVAWSKGSSATLEKWDGYRDAARIAIKRVTFKFISDPSAEMAALLAGDVDVFPRFSGLQNVAQFRADPRFQVLIGGADGKTILAVNNKRRPFDDVRVRQALAYAVDRKAVIDGAQDGLATPIGSHLVPNDPGYVDLTGAYPHDPDKAKALLAAAGVATPLSVTLTLPPPDYARQSGEIIAAELAEVGIEAKIEEVEWAQWLSKVYTDKNFDLTVISHVEPLDIGIYANPNYYFQYDSPTFRDIFARLQAAPDLDAFKAAIGDAQRQIVKDCVNVFLFQLPNVTIADARLQGLWKNAPIFVNDVGAMSWKP